MHDLQTTSKTLTNDWLNPNVSTSNCLTVYPNNSFYSYCWPAGYFTGRVKLALSEIEKLRGVAKKDAKLKAILQKFTDLIEITVDFE